MVETSSPVIVLDPSASNGEVDRALALAGELRLSASMARGDAWAAMAVGNGTRPVEVERFRGLASVERIVDVKAPYRLASREIFDHDMSVRVGAESGVDSAAPGREIGGGAPIAVMASIGATTLSDERLRILAGRIREAGGSMLFAGEMLTDAGEGVLEADLPSMARVRAAAADVGLALCVEVSDHRRIEELERVADVLQVGSRNMQDFNLLRELGGAGRPVLLKRGFGATVEEFLLAAEYVLSHGNGRVILCESGIRTFDAGGRPRFEINAVPVIKGATHLPLMADPSQATSHSRLVPAVARAAIAAGADGLVVEVCDDETDEPSELAIGVETFTRLMNDLEPIAAAVGRRNVRSP